MRDKILVVDDVEINRDILEEILKDEYRIIKAEDGKQAMEQIEKYLEEISIVLLDLQMPVMDGFAVLEDMNEKKYMEHFPVLIISGETSVSIEKKCFDYGVSDFIRKPFNSGIVKRRIKNMVDLYRYKDGLEDTVEQQTDMLRKQYLKLKLQAEKLQESNRNIIDILGTVVESRNLESGEHIQRVKGYVKILAQQVMTDYPEYGLTQHFIDVMVPASALHDVGKIAIPDSILLKPGKLTEDEYEYMKSHTTRGCEILDNIKGVWDEEYGKMCYEICRHHHERYDGKGYPDELQGDDIPISAQIVSIADVYDALVNERVYKDAYSKDKAFQMIIMGECGVFSPKLLECFRKTRNKFENMVL